MSYNDNELMPSSPANEALRESLLKQRAAVLSNLSRQGNVGGHRMSPDSRRTETAEQPHMGTLNLLPHSPREVSPPRNLSWEAGQHYGIGMPPNGQLALPQGPPGPMPPGPLFMPGQHMLVPHPSPPPQPPHVITKQTKDERPGFWLEGACLSYGRLLIPVGCCRVPCRLAGGP